MDVVVELVADVAWFLLSAPADRCWRWAWFGVLASLVLFGVLVVVLA